MKNIPEAILLLIVTAGICLTLTGCVNRQLTESYDQYLDTIGTEYLQYIESDPALNDNDKAIRQANHEHARQTVTKFKETKWSW